MLQLNVKSIFMNKKQTIRLTESDLHKIIKQSVNKVLNESSVSSFNGFLDQIEAIEDYLGSDNLVRRMTYFIYANGMYGEFMNYLNTNGDLQNFNPDSEDENLPGMNDPHGLVR